MTTQEHRGRTFPALSEALGESRMYRVVYWSGVTLVIVWSVFSAVSVLHGF